MTVSNSLSIDLDEVTRITKDVIAEQSLPLQVVGVVNGDGESAYTEVLINILGCHKAPCRVTLGVFRDATPESMRREISEKLTRHMQKRKKAS